MCHLLRYFSTSLLHFVQGKECEATFELQWQAKVTPENQDKSSLSPPKGISCHSSCTGYGAQSKLSLM